MEFYSTALSGLSITRSNSPDLWIYLNNEYRSFGGFIKQILETSCYEGFVNTSNLFFVADGFGRISLENMMLSRLEVYGAVKEDEKLVILRGIKYSISPLLLIFKEIEIDEYKSSFPLLEQIDSLSQSLKIVFHPKVHACGRFGTVYNPKIITPKRIKVSSIELQSSLSIKDDYGEPILVFPDYFRLNDNSIENLKGIKLTLVGTSHYTTSVVEEGTLCVLAAMKDNPYDDHAVQVFRWIPTLNTDYDGNYVHPLYKLGFVSRNENKDLHETMCHSYNHILFAVYHQGKLSIIGNLKDLNHDPYSNYVLPYSLFNLLMR